MTEPKQIFTTAVIPAFYVVELSPGVLAKLDGHRDPLVETNKREALKVVKHCKRGDWGFDGPKYPQARVLRVLGLDVEAVK
jgi:hypothetical protein